jgi:predicted ATPase
MKLRRLWLGNFYNLNDVEINFTDWRPDSSFYGNIGLRFFVGLNGSGKSNALEALGLIFSHLAISEDPGFEFDIEYQLLDKVHRFSTRIELLSQELEIDADNIRPISSIGACWLVRGAEEPQWDRIHMRHEWASSATGVLPDKVVGYSTGPTTGLDWALSRSIDRIVQERIGAFSTDYVAPEMDIDETESYTVTLKELRRQEREAYLNNPNTIFLSAADAMAAVLALTVFEGYDVDDYTTMIKLRTHLLDRVDLDPDDPLVSFSLKVSGRWNEMLTAQQRDRFRKMLQLATLRVPIERVPDPNELSEPPPLDFYAVFDIDNIFKTETVKTIDKSLLGFFESLMAWKRQDALQSIHLSVKKNSVEDLLAVQSLSDGEYLFLGRHALLLMLRGLDDCLILLDEPETHYNDQWKVDLVKDICTLLENPSDSSLSANEVIIATHSDLTLTDADPDQVYVFKVNDGNSIVVEHPDISPFAANRGSISQGLAGTDIPIGRLSKEIVEHVLREGDEKSVKRTLSIVGPGFYRFRLRDRLVELERSPDIVKESSDQDWLDE